MAKYVQGHERILKRYDGTAYKPLVCLTSTDFSQALSMIETINVCTNGEVESTPDSITRSVSFSGEIVDTSSLVGGMASGETIEELYTAQEESRTSGEADNWVLMAANDSLNVQPKYFKGFLSDASDSFAAGSKATFSGTITVNGVPVAVDPNE